MQRLAAELARAGMDCWLVEVPEDRGSRVDLLEEYPAGWKIALKQARRYADSCQSTRPDDTSRLGLKCAYGNNAPLMITAASCSLNFGHFLGRALISRHTASKWLQIRD